MWQPTLAASLLLLAPVSANVFNDRASPILRREAINEEAMRRYVDSLVEPIERRQAASPATNVSTWDQQTSLSCTTALEALNGNANNPSGMAVCYNLPFLDNSTGVFQADLRLFAISPPSGPFANIATGAVTVALQYSGATVSAVNASTLMRREESLMVPWPRDIALVEKRATGVPTLMQSYAFVGQINKDLLGPSLNTARIQKVLIPVVTLAAVDPSGNPINTTLSSGAATFVNGVFAAAAVPTKPTVQAPIQTLVVASNSPFVVPGLKILIFPIGGIVTGIWAILFIATVSYGTYGRMQFRDQFRRRTQMQRKGGQSTI